MKVTTIDRATCLSLVFDRTEAFLERIHAPEAFIVRRFYDPDAILGWREQVFESGQASEPTWHPCRDGCPDYHRLHDDYPKAHVKAKMHAFYFHGWYPHNGELFERFREIFEIKNHLGGFARDAFVHNVPSQHQIARVTAHHYPRGGGYQAEHIDPVAGWAKVQTLVQASRHGEDFHDGGLFARSQGGGAKHYLDEHTEPGDLILLSPGIQHGVDPVDPAEPYDWQSNHGRWIIMPIVLTSDEPTPDVVRPRQVGSA